MNDHDFQTMTAAMLQFGGSFVRDLALLMRCADYKNRARLIAAFDHIVTKFGPGSEPFAQMQQPKQVAV